MSKLIIATRKSPLALAQTEMVGALLQQKLGVVVEQLRIVTTGDRQTQWSLEKQGGKGLFTSELEEALRRGEADIAVHSTKDLPGQMAEGLGIAGYLPRADARDMLVVRADVQTPALVATSSPRRRLQLALRYPGLQFTEIRGNVDTRLRKIGQDRVADATMLAAAGLARLGIHSWDNIRFEPQPFDVMVPAVGQAAIAVQCRAGEESRFASLFDVATARAIVIERAFQEALGGGCHTAFAAHVAEGTFYLFHEETGIRKFELPNSAQQSPHVYARDLLSSLGLLR